MYVRYTQFEARNTDLLPTWLLVLRDSQQRLQDYRKNEGFESFNNPLTGMTSAIGSAFKTGLEDAEQTAGEARF
jgi:hypothetical protein